MRKERRSYAASFAVLIVVLGVVAVAVVAFAVGRPGRGDSPEAGPSARSAPRTAEPSAEPSVEPSASVEGSSSPEASPGRKIVIHAAGDTSLDPDFISTYRAEGYGYAWSGLDGLFENDDLSIVNLECAVSEKGSPVPKDFNFRGDPRALPAMRKAGVDVASLANNHAYDFGPEALVDTVGNLRDAGITPVGAGKDDVEAEAPAVFNVEGWRIAVVAWDAVVDPWPTAVAAPGHPGVAFGHDFNAVVRTVRSVSRRADLTIVQAHWGVELDTAPESFQIPQAHELIQAGADMIFGGHSHRVQPLDIYKGRPIFWSLGNFVWPNFSSAGATTGVAEVTVLPNGNIKARLLPAYITSPGHPVLR